MSANEVSCSCGCGEKKQTAKGSRLNRAALWLGIALFVTGMISRFIAPDSSGQAEIVLFLAAYFLSGAEVIVRALKNILRGKIFDENFLMALATAGAFAIGEYPECAAVMIFYRIGEAFQDYAVGRSRRSISALMDIRPDFANLKTGETVRKVSPADVKIGDLIIVKPGEKIPLDGIVQEGRAALDTSALTGESLPRDAEPGSEVLSGSINKNGLLTILVTKTFGDSTVSKILNLVQNAVENKAPVENFITKFARWYTPAVVLAALALAVIPPLVLPQAAFSDWLRRSLVFLVVSCPCALVLSIPLTFFAGLGGASRSGILVKGSNFLNALGSVSTVVFDKTGTLTRGVFSVTELVPAAGFDRDTLLMFAAAAESNSSHPIAVSILKAFGRAIPPGSVSGCEEIAGQGIRAAVNGKQVLAGNIQLLEAAGVPCPAADVPGSVIYLAVDGVFAGYIVVSDEPKPDSRDALAALKKLGVKKTVMLTGDSPAVAEKTGQAVGIDEVYAGLLPHQKVEKIVELKDAGTDGVLVFSGDGINDAPALARSDVGIAMGGIGSDAAIEAADVVLMTDEPSKIACAIRIAKKTRSIVRQNIVFALGVKAAILVLGALGMASMWEAVFGDVGVALIAILNALRALKFSGRAKGTSPPD